MKFFARYGLAKCCAMAVYVDGYYLGRCFVPIWYILCKFKCIIRIDAMGYMLHFTTSND
jgi:hypothetical protein